MKRPFLAAVAAIVAALLLCAAPAQAHTSLKSSDPQKNAQVKTLHEVTLEFADSVQFPVVVVRGEDGKRYEKGGPVVDGPKVTAAVTEPVPPGRYTIAWRVVSPDGHPLEGEIPFTVVGDQSVGAATSAAAPGGSSSAPATAPAAQADDGGQKGIPGWIWAVIFGIAGVGIGMFLSLRKKP
ncbi:copper resistance CopC family protein [Microbispora sp. NPDC088329]|uniref:copper resistance CopC family protein n=1 Tax=Microbispora sp. NPDC088329 TaxID=3154869 RepID=UPI00343C93B7